MTDEKLVAELRHPRQRNERYYEPLCARAADELERLAALAQSDAEPVQEWAAQICDDYARRFAMGRPYPQFKEIEVAFKEAAEQIRNLTAPPRPDDAEPVAWRYRVKGSSSWFVALKDDCDAAYWRASNYEVEPLYTARVMDNGEIR